MTYPHPKGRNWKHQTHGGLSRWAWTHPSDPDAPAYAVFEKADGFRLQILVDIGEIYTSKEADFTPTDLFNVATRHYEGWAMGHNKGVPFGFSKGLYRQAKSKRFDDLEKEVTMLFTSGRFPERDHRMAMKAISDGRAAESLAEKGGRYEPQWVNVEYAIAVLRGIVGRVKKFHPNIVVGDLHARLTKMVVEGVTPKKKASLRAKVIRLAHSNPELRPHLLPLIQK